MLGRVVAQYNLAFKSSDIRQNLLAGTFSTYPCNGSVGVASALNDESPNPVPGRNLRTSPLGTLSFYRAGADDVLEIVSVTYAKKADGQLAVLRSPLTSSNNPNPGNPFGQNEAAVIADGPMLPNTTYVRTTVLKINGKTHTDIVEFTTGV